MTVVAPFFNEAAGLEVFYARLVEQLDGLGLAYELIFVDDGSEDRTLELLHQLAENDSRLTVLALTRNFGHQAALTAGLDLAAGEAVVVMDSDLQHPPEVIGSLVTEYEAGADIVYAVRRNARLGLFKRLFSRIHYALMEHVSSVKMERDAADFRLMSAVAVAALRKMRETHRYLRGMVGWLGFPPSVVHYEQPTRHAGKPSYTWRKSLRMARHGIFSFSTIPLELVTWLGVGLTALGGVYLAYILIVTFRGETVAGWASVMVGVLVIGGVQLLSLGILAQYLGMLFEQSKGRPLYVVKQERRGGIAKEP